MKFTNQITERYEIVQQEDLSDIGSEGILLRHRKTGARIALMPNDDTNRVFYAAFRTPPKNSTGVAHIVEHTVLCGSEKYPVKDPFQEMVKGSLNTFLNAMTYSDKTVYPVASTNEKDFRNLVGVYLDAVFFPWIYTEPNLFRQEGISRRMDSADGALTLSGVVYNEMKGAYSSPDGLHEELVMTALFPDTPYGFDSGGDPDVIPELTYEAFLEFHRTCYHPANCYLYLYGELPSEEYLLWIDEAYLSRFSGDGSPIEIPMQKAFSEERQIRAEYPADREEEGAYLTWAVASDHTFSLRESLAFDAIEYALLTSQGAPIRRRLLEEGIGSEISGGLDDGILQPVFSCTAKGGSEDRLPQFLSIIKEELQAAASGGLRKESLLAALHLSEFRFREADYGMYPKGLMLGLDLLDSWLYDDAAVFDSMRPLREFEFLKKDAENGGAYFSALVRDALLNNPHAVTLVLNPHVGLAEEKERQLEQKLEEIRLSLSEEEKNRIVSETESLRIFQETPDSEEAIRSIPMLSVSDLSRENAPLRTEVRDAAGYRSLIHPTDTNGIAYLTLLFDATSVPAEDLPYLSILRTILLNISTEHYRYTELQDLIAGNTGGVSTGLYTHTDPAERLGGKIYLSVRAKLLYREIPFAMDIIREVLMTSVFSDHARILEILKEQHSRLKNVLVEVGNTTATVRVLSVLDRESYFREQTFGITYVRFLDRLIAEYDSQHDVLIEKLKSLSERLLRTDNLTVSLCAEDAGVSSTDAALPGLLSGLYTGAPIDASAGAFPETSNLREGLHYPGQVQYIAQAGDFGRAGFAYSGKLAVLRHVLNSDYLYQTIRLKGNAYGTGIRFTKNGLAVMMSYRDPHLAATLDAFRGIPEYLEKFSADPQEMASYIIGTIGSIDIPMTPTLFAANSLQAHLTGSTEEERQKIREEILSAGPEDIRALAPLMREVLSDGTVCVLGTKEHLNACADRFDRIDPMY